MHSAVLKLLAELCGYSPEEAYAKCLANCPILQHGPDYEIYALTEGRILVITQFHQWATGMGARPFDMPLLRSGKIRNAPEREMTYFVQPRAGIGVTAVQFDEFRHIALADGYRLVKPQSEHLVVHGGKVKLIAPWVACKPRPIREVLAEVSDEMLRESFYLGEMMRVFAGFPKQVLRLVMRPHSAMIFELEDGNFLHVSDNIRLLDSERGDRPFDAPILERGFWGGCGHDSKYLYFVQPPIDAGVTPDDATKFGRQVEQEGFHLEIGIHCEQLGKMGEQVVLLDPWAASRRRGY